MAAELHYTGQTILIHGCGDAYVHQERKVQYYVKRTRSACVFLEGGYLWSTAPSGQFSLFVVR